MADDVPEFIAVSGVSCWSHEVTLDSTMWRRTFRGESLSETLRMAADYAALREPDSIDQDAAPEASKE